MRPVNLTEKLAAVSERWSPKIVSTFNGHDLLVVKAEGEFVLHSHPDTDDRFLVLKGELAIQMRDGDVHLAPGDLFVMPMDVEHQPVATGEVHLLLIEPHGTPNTGDHRIAAARPASYELRTVRSPTRVG